MKVACSKVSVFSIWIPLGVTPIFSLPLKKRALSLSIRARTSSVALPKLTEFISTKSLFTATLYSAPPFAFVPCVTVVLSPATTVVCFLASASTVLTFVSKLLTLVSTLFTLVSTSFTLVSTVLTLVSIVFTLFSTVLTLVSKLLTLVSTVFTLFSTAVTLSSTFLS